MSGRGSIKYQVTKVLQAIFEPGLSRHDLKAKGQAAEHITGIGTMRAYTESNVRFAEWCKEEYKIRAVRAITPDMARVFVQGLHDRELSGGYIGKMVCAIRKLDTALRIKGLRAPHAPPLLPENGGWHSDRRPERAYTPQDAQRIEANLRQYAQDKQTCDAVKLQRVAGLRISEAAYIRGKDINAETGWLNVKKRTKGGRPRRVRVDAAHHDFLAELKARAEGHRDGHVFQGRQSLADRTRRAVREACERLGVSCYSTHGFRKTFAQARYRRLRESGLSDEQARERIASDLGHGRIQVTKSYIP